MFDVSLSRTAFSRLRFVAFPFWPGIECPELDFWNTAMNY
jgi:hypothetical protein